jgi:hypothetical protein
MTFACAVFLMCSLYDNKKPAGYRIQSVRKRNETPVAAWPLHHKLHPTVSLNQTKTHE